MKSIGKEKAAKNILKLAINITALTFLASCQSFYMDPGKTYGEIKIRNTGITTRERLVNDRLEEEAWLKEQLKQVDKAQFGNQGLSDIRTFTGVIAEARVGYDPAKMDIVKEQQKQQLLDLQRQETLKSYDYQIALEKKKAELAKVTTDPSTAGSTIYDNPSLTTGSGTPASPPEIPALSELKTKFENLQSLVPAPNLVEPTKAVASPIEVFRDKLAYRDEIRNEILQNGLDDAHDLNGNTLYRLNFDTTVIPANDTSAWAMVEVSVEPPKGDVEPTPERFAEIVNKKIENESQTVRVAVEKGCDSIPENQAKSMTTKEQLTNCLQKAQLDNFVYDFPANIMQTGAKQTFGWSFSTFSHPAAPVQLKRAQVEQIADAILKYDACSKGSSVCSLGILAGNFVAEYWARRLTSNPETIAFDLNSGVFTQSASDNARLKGFMWGGALQGVSVDKTKKSEAEQTVFKELYGVQTESTLTDTDKIEIRKAHISFLGATPKESVQRISDVAARRQATELALALNAVTGGANMNTALSYINQNDGFFHALKRQPLVVGYTDTDAFGWLIGPKYEIRNNSSGGSQVGYRHVPIQNGVSGMISVPVFWKTVQLKIHKYWQPEDGKPRVKADFTGGKYEEAPATVIQNLPARNLLAFDLFKERYPALEDKTQSNKIYSVTEKESASITLLGDNLWRSATVLMGGQEASKVTVLPDMKGIVANFDEVKYPGLVEKDSGVPEVPLIVVTAEGSVEAGKVRIQKAKAPAEKNVADKWEILGNAFFYPGSSFSLKPDSSITNGFAKLELKLLDSSAKSELTDLLSTASGIAFDSKNFEVTIPADNKSFKSLKNGLEYKVRVSIYKTPTDAKPTSVVIGSVVKYDDTNEAKVVYAVNSKKTEVDLTFPNNYQIAYSALNNDKPVNVKVSYKYKEKPDAKDSTDKTESISCAINKNKQCSLTTGNAIESITAVAVGDGGDNYPGARAKQ